jgi:hypothetical protein
LLAIGEQVGVPVTADASLNRLQWREQSSDKRDEIVRSILPTQEMHCMSASLYASIHDQCRESQRALEQARLRTYIERANERTRFHARQKRAHDQALQQSNAELLELTELLAQI